MRGATASYGLLLAAAVAAGLWLLMPLALTLAPGNGPRILHQVDPLLALCAGIIERLPDGLPRLGALVLTLTVAAIGFASARTLALLARTRRLDRSGGAVPPPPRLARAALKVGVADRLRFLRGPEPFAYCVGLWSPVIVISAGALQRLRDGELEAVLWHEARHMRSRDPLRVLFAHALAALLVGVPVIEWLARRFEIAKELDADRAALRATGDPASLAGALLRLSDAPGVGRAAVGAWSLTGARIDQLSGVETARVPALPRGRLGLTVGALLLALALALGQAARAHVLPAGILF